MEFKNKKLEIPVDDVFLNDKLKRKESVENISLLLRNISSPLVFSLNAPWGAGKTSYLNMLNANLKKSGNKTVYFSAWETDFASDPLLAFLGEMNLGLAPYLKGNSKKIKAWGKAKKAGAHILKRSIPVGLKIATAGLLDADKVFEDEASKLVESFGNDIIDSYSKSKADIVEFKESVREVLNAENSSAGNLYIFVDELDRCRPTYAIELLERIKHLLDIEGLVFVLALDKNQLAHSVRAVYGAEFDALGYLKRFIDIEFALPNAPIDLFVDYLYEHFGFVEYFQARELSNSTRYDGKGLREALKIFVVSSNMSLRSIEQLFSKINLILLMVKPNSYLYPIFVVFLLIVKDVHSDVYMEFTKPNSDGGHLVDVLHRMMPGLDSENKMIKCEVEAMIIASKEQSNKTWFDSAYKYARDTGEMDDNNPMNTNNPKIRRYYSDVAGFVGDYTSMRRGFPIEAIFNRINMLDGFNFDVED